MTDLPKTKFKKSKRLGRGYGSGKGGHTTGRGQKGQKARGKVNILFEGYKMKKSFIKRLPFRRGGNKFKAHPKPLVVNLKYLENFPYPEVSIETLSKARIVDIKSARLFGVKILGNGEITKKLTVSLPISKSARAKVEKAGGKVV